METKLRKINWSKIILAFLIASFIFSFGLLVGYLSKQIVESSTITIEDTLRNEFVNIETLGLLESKYPCDSFVLDKASEKLEYLGQLISLLETKKGKENSDVLELKKLYSVLEVRHMLLTEERNSKCGANYTTILFFYSNNKDCEKSAEKVSFILTYLRNKYNFVRIYSFDLNLNSDISGAMKSYYNIDSCYGVVINDQKVTKEIQDSKDIEYLINKRSS